MTFSLLSSTHTHTNTFVASYFEYYIFKLLLDVVHFFSLFLSVSPALMRKRLNPLSTFIVPKYSSTDMKCMCWTVLFMAKLLSSLLILIASIIRVQCFLFNYNVEYVYIYDTVEESNVLFSRYTKYMQNHCLCISLVIVSTSPNITAHLSMYLFFLCFFSFLAF